MQSSPQAVRKNLRKTMVHTSAVAFPNFSTMVSVGIPVIRCTQTFLATLTHNIWTTGLIIEQGYGMVLAGRMSRRCYDDGMMYPLFSHNPPRTSPTKKKIDDFA